MNESVLLGKHARTLTNVSDDQDYLEALKTNRFLLGSGSLAEAFLLEP